MGILESVILVLVIGFTVIVTAYAIIQKIYDEGRKNSKMATEEIGKILAMIQKAMTEAYKELEKRGEEA